MHNLDIYNIADTPDIVIDTKLKYLNDTIDVMHQSMLINQRCYNAIIGTHHESTMLRWKLHKAYLIMQTQCNDAMNEMFYIQDLQERAEQFHQDIRDAISDKHMSPITDDGLPF